MADDNATSATGRTQDKDVVGSKVEDEDSGITMVDVLEEEEELENDANAVLGGSDDQNCTYPQGYVKRQALYACKTCTIDNREPAGVCLACSYACHEGHELLELYTKRNFCCDCGNQKFSSNPCKLFPNKSPLNTENSYNQNFFGSYCICKRPYPDPDDNTSDEMVQCIACEDWYHGRHLGKAVPSEDDYGEMICGNCMTTCDFLWPYVVHSVVAVEKEDKNNVSVVDVVTEDNPASDSPTTGLKRRHSSGTPEVNGVAQSAETNQDVKTESSPVADKVKVEVDPLCKYSVLRQTSSAPVTGATFWPDGWREKLCVCDKCKLMYKEKGKSFLAERQDTVHAYEEKGKAKQSGQSQYDQGMQALSSLDRIRQVEAIYEYNSMKTELKDFLKSFAEEKKVVKKEDIDEFFSQMRARKRQQPQVSIPQFCR